MTTNKRNFRKVPLGSPIFPDRPPLPPEEIARLEAEDEAFAQRCREIFWQLYPKLIKEHYNWAIMIEPESGDYCIDPDPEIAFQKICQKYPNARIMEKRLNETGCVGRI